MHFYSNLLTGLLLRHALWLNTLKRCIGALPMIFSASRLTNCVVDIMPRSLLLWGVLVLLNEPNRDTYVALSTHT